MWFVTHRWDDGDVVRLVLAHWNNNSWVNISLHSDSLFPFCANPSLILLFYDVYTYRRNSQYQLYSLWFYPTVALTHDIQATLLVNMLTITPQTVEKFKPYLYIHWVNSRWGLGVMVFNATFNIISVISSRSVLLVEEIRVPGENHRPVASQWRALSQCCIEYTSPWEGFELTMFSGNMHWLHR